MNFSAVILAGGRSSRMGRDKAWLDVGGQILLARQISLARETGAAEIFISGRPDADYSAFGCRVLQDKFPGAGPLAGIERALDAVKSPLLLVLAVDLPEMNGEFLRRLAAHCTENVGTIPRLDENIEPLVAFYPKAASGLLIKLLNVAGHLPINPSAPSPRPSPPMGERENRASAFSKSMTGCGSEHAVESGELQSLSPLPGGEGQGEGKRVTKKTASAKHFAELCVQSGLVRFIELPASDAKYFANWNSPADLASTTRKIASLHEG